MAEVDDRAGVGVSTSAGVGEPSPATVAAHIEALNLTGLSFAVRRLLGKDPLPVTNQFTMWARQGRKGLPGVNHAYWRALAPLRIGRPASPAAAVCDQVLKGRERDGALGLAAAGDCAKLGKATFAPLHEGPLRDDGASEDAERRKALIKAVKDYWRLLGTMYGDIRPPVTEGDLAAAVGRMRRAEPALREVIERVAALATGVAGQHVQDIEVQAEPTAAEVDAYHQAGPGAAGYADQGHVDQGHAEQGHVQQGHADQGYADQGYADPGYAEQGYAEDWYVDEDVRLRRRPGDPDPVMARAEAFAQQRRLREEPDPEPRPVEVLSTKPVRTHVFLPIVFGLLVAGLALYVIFTVLNAPNPLQ